MLSGVAPATGGIDLDAAVESLRSVDADVLAVQEVDRLLPRSGTTSQLQDMADALGYVAIFAPALLGDPLQGGTSPSGRDPGGPAYGIGLLTRWPPLRWRRLRLPGGGDTRSPHPARSSPGWDREPRVAVQAQLPVGDGILSVTTTHLSYLPWRGARQLRALLPAAGRRQPAVLLGDFNLPPWAVARLAGGWDSAGGEATYPADAPRIQVDHILGRGVALGRARARRLPVSDHIALVSDLEVR